MRGPDGEAKAALSFLKFLPSAMMDTAQYGYGMLWQFLERNETNVLGMISDADN